MTIKLKDPSGNSTIKNPFAPKLDKNMEVTHFKRSLEELEVMGYSKENAEAEKESIDNRKVGNKINFAKPFEESSYLNKEAAVF